MNELNIPRVVLITGCSKSIGHDLAQRLTQAGYMVVATARRMETLNDLQAALKLPLDVTLSDSVNDAVAQILQKFGRIDVLVNNAGYALRGALEKISGEQVQQMFSDALGLKLAPIQVVLIGPGAVKTHFDETAQALAQNILSNSASP